MHFHTKECCRQVWFVCGWQLKLCDPLVTHESYLSAVRWCVIIERYINTSYFTYLLTYLLTYFADNMLSGDAWEDTEHSGKADRGRTAAVLRAVYTNSRWKSQQWATHAWDRWTTSHEVKDYWWAGYVCESERSSSTGFLPVLSRKYDWSFLTSY